MNRYLCHICNRVIPATIRNGMPCTTEHVARCGWTCSGGPSTPGTAVCGGACQVCRDTKNWDSAAETLERLAELEDEDGD